MISQETLLQWDRWGLFKGPLESIEAFVDRATQGMRVVPKESSAITLLEALFQVTPHWVSITQSAKGLRPWEGAATWIDQSDEGIKGYRIQIKPSLSLSKSEVVAHEMVHAMRLGFEHSLFEEVLAYQTSASRWRRYFGPLFSRPKEVWILLSALFLPWVVLLGELLLDIEGLASVMIWVPWGVLGYFLCRLVRTQYLFKRCLQQLQALLKDPFAVRAVALRLTAQEIQQFSVQSPQEILTFAQQEQEQEIRWKQLYYTYFTRYARLQ